MKTPYKIFFIIGLVLLIILHAYLYPGDTNVKDGFMDDTRSYDILRSRLQKDLGPYCKIASFIRDQVNEMQTATGGRASDINQMYTSVYQCTDQLASTRASCSTPNKTGMRFVPCSIYMDLPEWSDDVSVVNSLRKIKDDLPERLTREIEWFNSVIKKIKDGLAAGANPAAGANAIGVAPTMDQMNAFKEGFDGYCSPEASAYLRQQEVMKEATSCTVSTPSSEIARVNSLLDNPSVSNSVSQCNKMTSQVLKLQSDLEKLKNGTLYAWQQDGPKKSFPKFEGGDRTKSFLFSLQQNQ
jgi:hypothetical protein